MKVMAEQRYIKIGDEKLLHPDYLEELPAHRVLSYYRKNVAGLPGKYVYNCGCCNMRRSDITYNNLTASGIPSEDAEGTRQKIRERENLYIKYKNTVKSILDDKEHVPS